MSDRLARELDPDVAERVINAVLGHGTTRDLDKEAVTRAKLVLLAGLVADAQLDDAGLDEFLAAARKLADQLAVVRYTRCSGLVVSAGSWLPKVRLPDRKDLAELVVSYVLASWHCGGMQSVYEAAGGRDGLLRLAGAWHSRVMADEKVSHAFSGGFHPQHTERLAAYWAEAGHLLGHLRRRDLGRPDPQRQRPARGDGPPGDRACSARTAVL